MEAWNLSFFLRKGTDLGICHLPHHQKTQDFQDFQNDITILTASLGTAVVVIVFFYLELSRNWVGVVDPIHISFQMERIVHEKHM